MARPSRAKPSDQLVRHWLERVDIDARVAVCRKCGPVQLVWKSGRWACEAKGRDARREHLLTRYGITPEEYDSLLAEQEGRCRICEAERALLHVDHDHETNEVRGLLCGNCNRGLGIFSDDPARLRAAARYLEES